MNASTDQAAETRQGIRLVQRPSDPESDRPHFTNQVTLKGLRIRPGCKINFTISYVPPTEGSDKWTLNPHLELANEQDQSDGEISFTPITPAELSDPRFSGVPFNVLVGQSPEELEGAVTDYFAGVAFEYVRLTVTLVRRESGPIVVFELHCGTFKDTREFPLLDVNEYLEAIDC